MRQTRITTKRAAAALLVAAAPLAAKADGLRIPFIASLQGGGRVILPVGGSTPDGGTHGTVFVYHLPGR